ncbi:MAG: nuclear transport factor 2 family protein [Pseudomonadota bacterium]
MRAPFDEIEETISFYLDGIHQGDVALLQRAMHPDCRMACISSARYLNIGMNEYFDLVENRQSPLDVGETRCDKVHSIQHVQEEIAFVRLGCLVLGKDCEDLLTLIRDGGKWQIISKVYAVKPFSAAS